MKIKVGIIGCGSISELRHAPEYKSNGNAEIAAFCDPVPERAEKLAAKFGGRAFSNYREVLGLPELDAISVCTSNSTHAAIAIEALKAGKHVLCEKPMATSLEDARAMISAAEENGRVLMVGHNQRFAVAHVKARQIIQSAELGRVLTFRTTFGHSGPEQWSADKGRNTWFFRKDAAAVGALGDLGIHKADLVRWLIGEEITEIGAVLSTRDKCNETGEPIDVEDNAICLLKTDSGIIGSMTVSWTYYGVEDNSTVFYCENGIIRLYGSPEFQLTVEKPDGEKVCYKTGNIQTNASQNRSGIIDAFLESIIKGTKPAVSGYDGFEALSIIMACMESFQEKAFVKVTHF